MLTHSFARQQRGAILFLALIVLVVMLLGGAALFRIVDAGTLAVGNVAMQRSATRSGDAGVEQAALWLSGAGASLYIDNPAAGYIASGLSYFKGTNQSWAEYWTALTDAATPVVLAEDAAGNTSSYLIQRLCDQPGAPFSDGPPPVSCTTPPRGTSTGSSMSAGFIALNRPTGTYYRVLVRTTGARGVVSYLQVMMYM